MVTLWSVSLWLLLMPLVHDLLPDPWLPVIWGDLFDLRSSAEALPLAGFGALLLAMAIVVTRQVGTLHARFARGMLGAGRRQDA